MWDTRGLTIVMVALLIGFNGCGRTDSTAQTQPGSVGAPTVKAAKEVTLDLGNDVVMKLVLIPAGNCVMGSPRTERGHTGDEAQKEVTVSNPFYMSVCPVTVDQYYGRRPSVPAQTGDQPVVDVSWDDAQNFCKQLSTKTGRKVVLPSQAQWEYACRAGSTTAYYFGDDAAKLGDYAWFADNSGNVTHPVGQKKPNAWGLYDMHGNVAQWCSDYLPEWGKGPDDLTTDGWRVRDFKVLRGGSYGNHSDACRSASLRAGVHTERSSDRGFRVIVLP